MRRTPVVLLGLVAVLELAAARPAHAQDPLPAPPPRPDAASVLGVGVSATPPTQAVPCDGCARWARRPGLSISIPVWVPGVSGSLATGTSESQTDGSFLDRFVLVKDAVTELRFAFVGRVEFSWRRWWAMVDMFGATIGSEVDWSFAQQNTDVELEALIGRAVVGYQAWCVAGCGAAGARIAFTPYVGVRGYDVDLRINAASGSRDWLDAIAGLEVRWWISPRWSVRALMDVGTGLGEGSDLVWSAGLEVQYHFSRTFSMFLGFNVLDLRYDRTDPDRFLFDLTLAGPEVGIALDL